MTTPSRYSNAVSKTVAFLPRLFKEFLYPVTVGCLRISGALLKNGAWLIVAVASFLSKSLHDALESFKNLNNNQNQ